MVKKYTEKDIQVLSDRDHVRLRLPIYAGNTEVCSFEIPLFINNTFSISEVKFAPATYKVINEIIDNSLDEFSHITQKDKVLKIIAEPLNGKYSIQDNGRGIPIGKHEIGKYTPEVVLSSLRSGRNFISDKETGVIGQNGIGASMTNFCSKSFDVTVYRDHSRYIQHFEDGCSVIKKPKITSISSKKTGTQIDFILDETVFKQVALPETLIENRAIELAMLNSSIGVEYNTKKYKFKNGLDDIVKNISKSYFKFELNRMEFFIIFDLHTGNDEKMFTWVNSSLLFDGGMCNVQFMNGFVDKVMSTLEKDAKKNKCEISRVDIKPNLLILGCLKISNPEYDSQAKTKLIGPNLKKEFVEMIDSQWSSFSRKNKDWLNKILQRSIHRFSNSENDKAIKLHKKNLTKKVAGLVDATSKYRKDCRLLITEGLSASSAIVASRDPKTIASFPLTGKINNVYGATNTELLKMGKITNLLSAIGLVPGQSVDKNELRFGKIIISTDADFDGSDIMAILVNLFFQFWPELFDKHSTPVIHRLIVPNIVASKNGKRIHFTTKQEFEKVKEKYKGWTIEYMKGLGSMIKQDWDMILSNDDYLISIVDDGNMKNTLELLFGNDVNARKEWLTKK